MRSVAAHLLGPDRCAGCGVLGSTLCGDCASSIRPAPGGDRIAGVDRIVVPWAYEGAARSLLLALKLNGRRSAAEPLVDAMHRELLRAGVLARFLTFVPGRPAESRRRGFDHAELLARLLAHRTGSTVLPLLRTVRQREDQTLLGRAERARNLAGAFAADGSPERVVLVDDLVTTGATARACAAALRAAGARSVDLAAVCRA